MTHVEILDADRGGVNGYKVDVNRGERIGRVSSEWFSRPDRAWPDPNRGECSNPRRGQS